MIKNKTLKNTLALSIFCCGLLFSCGGSKKTTQFDESLYDDESSEILVIDETEADETISQDLTLENTLRMKMHLQPSIPKYTVHPLRFEIGKSLTPLLQDSLLLSFDTKLMTKLRLHPNSL